MADYNRVFFIFDGEGPMDGEFYRSAEAVFHALQYADAGDRVFEWVMDENTTRDVTEDMVRDGYNAGELDRHHPLVWAHLSLPETYAEHLGNIADAQRQSGKAA